MRPGPAVAITLLLGLACPAGAADLIGSFAWHSDRAWLGGLSGLAIDDDGRQLTAISDRGLLVTARLHRQHGVIVAADDLRATRLRSSRDVPLARNIRDAEGLALLPGGGFCVSFEGLHRVACYATPDAPAQVLDRPPGFSTLPGNGSFEALAADTDGRLYILPEDALDAAGMIPVHRWDGHAWTTPFTLPSRDRFLPVGADFGPDGRLYLLERDFGLWGFRSRLRRWDVAGDTPTGEITLLETAWGAHDNLEGVSVWRDPAGQLRATLIADDNFLFFQQTEIVEYTLPD
jgi:hypothetical protein